MGALVTLLSGIAAGMVLVWLLLRRSFQRSAADRYAAWRAEQGIAVRRGAVASRRGEIKATLGQELPGPAGLLPFEPSDVRFLGDPVTFVVFDGHGDLKDRAGTSLRSVSFVTMGDAPSGPSEESLLVAECVAAGRVEWLTVRLP